MLDTRSNSNVLDHLMLELARYPNFGENHMLELARYPNFLMLAHPYGMGDNFSNLEKSRDSAKVVSQQIV